MTEPRLSILSVLYLYPLNCFYISHKSITNPFFSLIRPTAKTVPSVKNIKFILKIHLFSVLLCLFRQIIIPYRLNKEV